jgi:hypothetical protein
MAIRKEWLLPLAKLIVRNSITGRAYALGDQVTYFTHEYAVRKLARAGYLANPGVRPESHHENPELVSVRTLLAMLGIDEYYDIDINGQAALTLDFSQDLPPELRSSAALVLDIGTIEHIFDAAHAFANVVTMVRPGGFAIHYSPVSWFNHGFYNFNPLLFREFYESNGFHVIEHSLVFAPLNGISRLVRQKLNRPPLSHSSLGTPFYVSIDDDRYFFDLLATFVGIPTHSTLLFAAQKVNEVDRVRYPVQGQYRARIAEQLGNC